MASARRITGWDQLRRAVEPMMMTLLPIAVGVVVVDQRDARGFGNRALFALVRMEHTREGLGSAVRRSLDRLMARPLESLVVIIGLNEAANVFAECLATALC